MGDNKNVDLPIPIIRNNINKTDNINTYIPQLYERIKLKESQPVSSVPQLSTWSNIDQEKHEQRLKSEDLYRNQHIWNTDPTKNVTPENALGTFENQNKTNTLLFGAATSAVNPLAALGGLIGTVGAGQTARALTDDERVHFISDLAGGIIGGGVTSSLRRPKTVVAHTKTITPKSTASSSNVLYDTSPTNENLLSNTYNSTKGYLGDIKANLKTNFAKKIHKRAYAKSQNHADITRTFLKEPKKSIKAWFDGRLPTSTKQRRAYLEKIHAIKDETKNRLDNILGNSANNYYKNKPGMRHVDLERFNNSEFKNINPKNNNVRFLSKRYYADRNPDIYFENNDIGNSGAYRMSEKYTPIEVSLRTAYKENGKLRPSKILRKPINVKSTYAHELAHHKQVTIPRYYSEFGRQQHSGNLVNMLNKNDGWYKNPLEFHADFSSHRAMNNVESFTKSNNLIKSDIVNRLSRRFNLKDYNENTLVNLLEGLESEGFKHGGIIKKKLNN